MTEIRPIRWAGDKLELLDQTRLPQEQITLEVSRYQDAVEAICTMRVRGAPAIGVTAAYAIVLAARQVASDDLQAFLAGLERAAAEIAAARPTAVNLQWAVNRMLRVAREGTDATAIQAKLLSEAQRIQDEDEEINRRMGAFGKDLLPQDGAVLTHCNAGALATAGFGTAVGVIRAGWEDGKRYRIFNTETRPFLQGSRLTAWEFQQLGIPATLIVDSAAGMMMQSGHIDCVITGADRIATNGDTANKIGTYSLAVLAKENNIPFYVAAPTSTIDLDIDSGDHIQIEQRPASEVLQLQGVPTAPQGVSVMNPAFDVTPHRYVTAIITEAGVARPPYLQSLAHAAGVAAAA